MRANITLNLNEMSPEDAQHLLHAVCTKFAEAGAVSDYAFSIETAHGTVTEKCILSQGHVVA